MILVDEGGVEGRGREAKGAGVIARKMIWLIIEGYRQLEF